MNIRSSSRLVTRNLLIAWAWFCCYRPVVRRVIGADQRGYAGSGRRGANRSADEDTASHRDGNTS